MTARSNDDEPASRTITATGREAGLASIDETRVVPCLTVVQARNAGAVGHRLVPGKRPVVVGRETRSFEGRGLGDPEVSGRHLEVHKDGTGAWIRDLSSKNGTVVSGRPLGGQAVMLAPGDVVWLGNSLLLCHSRAAVAPPDAPIAELVGTGDAMRVLRSRLHRYASRPSPVLVMGETGTGKELAASALGALGRPNGPFRAFNATTVAPELMAATLFGHERGAFTGATVARPGLFRDAHRGTLFLDEIGELDERVQVQLLRVLEEGKVTPVGATRPVDVDVRVVAATHRDLAQEVAAGRFRADLYSRLDQLRLLLPSLRERLEDVPLLAQHFARTEAGREVTFAVATMERLLRHPWPFNVRELRGVVSQLLADGPARPGVEPVRLSTAVVQRLEEHATLFGGARESGTSLDRDTVVRALQQTAGNMSRAAALLGKDRGQLYRVCKRLGVDAGEFR